MNTFNDLDELKRYLHAFATDRDWKQFQSPKNLAMALSVEAAELLEHFQWLSEAESHALSHETHHDVQEEMADVLMYLVRLADVLNIDLLAAATHKSKRNENRFPVDKVKGSRTK